MTLNVGGDWWPSAFDCRPRVAGLVPSHHSLSG